MVLTRYRIVKVVLYAPLRLSPAPPASGDSLGEAIVFGKPVTNRLVVSVNRLWPHSIVLASCKPGFRPGLQPGFRQVCAGLRHAFDFFLSKTWSQTCCINLNVRSSLGFKQVCSWLSTRSRKSKARFAARFAAC